MFWPIPFLELYHSKGTTPYANFTIGFDKLPDRRIDVGETERHRIAPRVFEGAGNHVCLRNVDEFRRAGVLLQWIDERLIERL